MWFYEVDINRMWFYPYYTGTCTLTLIYLLFSIEVVEPDELKEKAGLMYPHTSHCLANGDIMISAMGDAAGNAKGNVIYQVHLFQCLSH